MKKLTAWLTLSAFSFLGSVAVVSCGSDEATGDDDGGGIIGGSGGMEGGVVRDSGTTDDRLGRACATDAECGDTGLICVKADDPALGGGAPPRGLCTTPCTTDDICLEYAPDAYCVPFGARNSDAYCLEACTTGAGLDTAGKCHAREEFACSIIGLIPQTDTCTTYADCATGELCNEGVCGTIVTACLPMCGGDYDCADGFFCDFSSGLCVSEDPTGKDLNALCDAEATVDECNGFCSESADDPTVGTCTAFCNIGSVYGCGFSGEGQADAACLFSSIIAPDPGAGDVGLCGQLCDCNSDCLAPGDFCAPIDYPDLEQIWQRTGYCRSIGSDFTEADSLDCGSTGTGGAGGSGGEPGTGGAPSGTAGAGGA